MGPSSQGGKSFFFRTHFLVCEDVAGGSQQSWGESLFLPVIWTHFLACEDVAGRSQQSGGKRFFFSQKRPVQWVPAVRWRYHYFPRNKEALPCCDHGPSCQPLHIQYTSDGSRSLTMLNHATSTAPGRWTTTTPRKGTTRSRGRRSSGSPRGEEYEGSLVRLRCEATVAA